MSLCLKAKLYPYKTQKKKKKTFTIWQHSSFYALDNRTEMGRSESWKKSSREYWNLSHFRVKRYPNSLWQHEKKKKKTGSPLVVRMKPWRTDLSRSFSLKSLNLSPKKIHSRDRFGGLFPELRRLGRQFGLSTDLHCYCKTKPIYTTLTWQVSNWIACWNKTAFWEWL